MKSRLSTLWIFILFNTLFRDVHDLFRSGAISEIESGIVNGRQITEQLMLLGGFVVEIPILMILVSILLNREANRWINIVIGLIGIPATLANGPRDMDDIFFIAVILIAHLAIVVHAWTWKINHKESLS